MKIALIGDLHLGARQDSLILLDYTTKFLQDVFFPYLQEHDIKTCIIMGDLLDRRKYINYKTLRVLREEFINRLGTENIDTHIILGNHCCFYKNTADINSPQELFTSFDGKFEPWIYSTPKEIQFGSCLIGLLPWITAENSEESMEFIANTKSTILVAHLELAGFEMHAGSVNYHGLDKKIFNKFEKVLTGHYHKKSDDGTIFYLGAPYQMTWADYGETCGFHIFDTETHDLEFIENPYNLFNKVTYDEDIPVPDAEINTLTNTYVKIIVANKQDPFLFDSFLDSIYAVNPADVMIIEDLTGPSIADSDIDFLAEDTPTLLKKYVDQSALKGVDKPRLKRLLHELYVEAVSLKDEIE